VLVAVFGGAALAGVSETHGDVPLTSRRRAGHHGTGGGAGTARGKDSPPATAAPEGLTQSQREVQSSSAERAEESSAPPRGRAGRVLLLT